MRAMLKSCLTTARTRVLAVVLLAAATTWRLSNEGLRFFDDPVDLRLRWLDVTRWFAGETIYGVYNYAVYPPASHLLLWPLVGWTDLSGARLLWLCSALLALVAIAWLLVRLTRPRGGLEAALVLLTPLAMYASAATLGNGQLGLHLTALLLGAVWLAFECPPSLRRDGLLVALLLLALVKPSFSVPVVLLVVAAPGAWRPLLGLVVAYLGVTLLVALPQQADALALMGDWLHVAPRVHVYGGYGDLSSWLRRLGLPATTLPVSGLALAGLTLWLWRHRGVDPWLQLGVAGLVARLFFYHRLFDDLLILLPMLALWRQARVAERQSGLARFWLLLLWCGALAPARLLAGPEPGASLFAAGQSLLWLGTLIYLASVAAGEHATLREGQNPRPEGVPGST